MIYRIWIQATPQQVWDAITDPAFNTKYGYGLPTNYDLRPGGAYLVPQPAEMIAQGAPAVMIDGEVLESDPPKRLVQTWHAHFTPETSAEGPTRLTWDLLEVSPGQTRLTVTHDLEQSPMLTTFVQGDVEQAGGGWPMILSDLKTYLETGKSFLLDG
jgi:uncharacterized protein YndB with AHSA1/START domain